MRLAKKKNPMNVSKGRCPKTGSKTCHCKALEQKLVSKLVKRHNDIDAKLSVQDQKLYERLKVPEVKKKFKKHIKCGKPCPKLL